MHVSSRPAASLTLLFAGFLTCAGMCGCQANIGGQTLPSAYYLRDDVQYFAPGPENPLPNAVRAANEYRAQQGDFAKDYAPLP